MSSRITPSLIRYTPRLRARGIDILRDPQTNKGNSYSLRERQLLGLHGLLPPNPQSQALQAQRILNNLYQLDDNLSRYSMLMSLQDRNEKLFYQTVRSNLEYCLPIIYTPTVAQACQNFGSVFRRPRGLYITIQDRGHVHSILKNWPIDSVEAVVMTDGERILGFGDLGANGIAVPLSKAILYTSLGGIQPHVCLPIMLDVGTDNEDLLEDEFYVGLRRKRARGDEYLYFVDEVMEALTTRYVHETELSNCFRPRYGPKVCIHFADLKTENAFHFLERYRDDYVVFNDDIQGSAVAILAGLISSSKITKRKLFDNTYLFYGAGGASIGTARLLVKSMMAEGYTEEAAKSRIYMMDSHGLVVSSRPEDQLSKLKADFARSDMGPIDSLVEVVRAIKPSVLIGASAKPGAFTREILRELSFWNKKPIIFALSNPNSLAECTAELAYKTTEWKCIFVSGSPSPPVRSPEGRILLPSQCNNCSVFPGLIAAITRAVIHPVTDELLLTAAKTLASSTTDEGLKNGSIFPETSNLQEVSRTIALALIDHAFKENQANIFPEPEDKKLLLESAYYDHTYIDFTPDQYPW